MLILFSPVPLIDNSIAKVIYHESYYQFSLYYLEFSCHSKLPNFPPTDSNFHTGALLGLWRHGYFDSNATLFINIQCGEYLLIIVFLQNFSLISGWNIEIVFFQESHFWSLICNSFENLFLTLVSWNKGWNYFEKDGYWSTQNQRSDVHAIHVNCMY